MVKYIIVTDKPKLIDAKENCVILTEQDYIGKKSELLPKSNKAKVVNLSASYSYLSQGYYVSLLAQARGRQCFPNLENIVSLNWQRNYVHSFPELNVILEKNYDLAFEDPLVRKFTSFFGRHENPKIEPLTRRIFDLFRIPIFSFEIKYTDKKKWNIVRIEPEALGRLIPEQIEVFNRDLSYFVGSAWRTPPKKKQERYWLSILYDPDEKNPPSNAGALKKFVDIGKKMNVWVDLITKNDLAALLEYDALLIRETTAINNHTYRFAQKAENEGIPTIDDMNSIIKCCNKVYLNELLEIGRIDRPHTIILNRNNLREKAELIEFPSVLKIPDGAFSKGVFKVSSLKELLDKATELFKRSELILCQEFLPSAFDWRIGVLDNKPLFASKYYMARGHWQIYNHGAKSENLKTGGHQAVPIDQVPPKVLEAALQSCKLIGDSLYGVDIKELESGRVVVIEVNDNPNIDRGYEDKILGDELYRRIIEHLISKIEEE